jgi:bifunctional UDP-N-acetylglucosamine pyrophosphorylase/glucosamine-1-phosphate N-acetyltransferase
MIKKVLIAAAGEGVRMRSLTKNKPKHLIKVKKRPFLSYLFDNILLAGYKELILVIGYKAQKFQEFFKNYRPPKGKKSKYKVHLVNQFEILGEPKGKERVKYGTACPLMCVGDIVGQENFLVVFGDNLYSVKDLRAFNIDDKYNYAAGVYHQHPEKYGVLISDKRGFLKKIVEKPKRYVGDLVNISLYKFTPEIFDKVSKIKKSPRGEYELTDAVTLLAKEKKVKIKMIQDYWLDFGNPADIIRISQFFKKHRN